MWENQREKEKILGVEVDFVLLLPSLSNFDICFALTLYTKTVAPLFAFSLKTTQKLAKKMNFEHLRVAQSLKKCILINKNGIPGRKHQETRQPASQS